jgi:ATP-binding cassette subfamily B multidrug efflux pump
MLSWFEKRIDPFPAEAPDQPPATLLAFCWHYTKGIWPWLAVTSVLIALISGCRWLCSAFSAISSTGWPMPTGDLPCRRGLDAVGMGFVILMLLPGLSVLHTMVMHQTCSATIRW